MVFCDIECLKLRVSTKASLIDEMERNIANLDLHRI